MTEHKCKHVANESLPAITRVTHRMLPGAPSRSDVESETDLCAICSGALVAILMQLETGKF